MRKFIRKYNQETIALLLIVGFWGGMWGYHMYQTNQSNAAEKAATLQPDPNLANK